MKILINKFEAKRVKTKKLLKKYSEAFFGADNRTRTYTPCGTRS